MPRRATGESWASYSRELRCSIFVGPIETGGSADGDKSVESSINGARKEKESSGKSVERVWYGTQKQTVLLVDWAGMATFVERTLEYEDGVRVHSGQGERMFKFEIETCCGFLREPDCVVCLCVFVHMAVAVCVYALRSGFIWVSCASLYILYSMIIRVTCD